MIEVTRRDHENYTVTVEGATTTRHEVKLSAACHEDLTGGKATPEALIEESFRFLLEREPNTSILSSFELSLIGRYFPEYRKEIRQRVGT